MLVYGIKNKETNKMVYIGQTIRSLPSRWSQHIRDALKGKLQYPLYRAIRRYGSDHFEVFEICKASNREELDLLEKNHILQMNTLTPNGYNLMLGQKGGEHSQESIEQIRQAALRNGLGKWKRTEEDNKKNSERKKKLFANKEFKDNFLIANGSREFNVYKAKIIGNKHSANKIVEQGELVGTWLSTTDCAKDLNLKGQPIRKALSGKMKTYQGLIFKHKENYNAI